MNKETQSILVGLLGGLLVSITASGRFTNYVKPGFGPLLMAAGIALLIVGVISLIQAIRSEVREHKAIELAKIGEPAGAGADVQVAQHADDDVDAHGHQHDGSRAPWLILVPVLVLLLIAPAALGADAVARSGGSQALAGLDAAAPVSTGDGVTGDGGYKPNDGSGRSSGTSASGRRTMPFNALPGGRDPQITLKDFILRALYDGDNSVSRNPVTVTGFIAGPGEGQSGGYTIARMIISCCAADANAMRVHVDGAAPFPANTWVTAVVSAKEGTGTMANDYVPTADVQSIQKAAQPSDPYEH